MLINSSSPAESLSPAELERRWAAHNYDPLPVTLVSGEGAWVRGDDGTRYLDLLSAYSALNFGHRHPALLAAARHQLDRLTLTSRAFGNDQLGPFCAELASLVGLDGVIVMNTGAEAVETAIKAARRWAYQVKGVAPGQATIITAAGNFHGRTTTIVGFSTDPDAREGFGPFTPGFITVPFGDLEAVARSIDESTAGVLIEPIQGEAGVMIPPPGYLSGLRRLCDEHRVLLIADEVQSGLGRTGSTLACEGEGVKPDVVVLGKALGGGIVALSAVVAHREVVDVFTPGSHGSTFGGNPLACAIGRAVVGLLQTGELQRRAAAFEPTLIERLSVLVGRGVRAVRVRGLWAGIDLDDTLPPARAVCEALASRRVLAKDAHGHRLRLAPPLVIDPGDLDWGIEQLAVVVGGLHSRGCRSPGTGG
ncbi:MAG: ornithine--oxo-acid transaminase [Acidimicrobiales bacterium]